MRPLVPRASQSQCSSLRGRQFRKQHPGHSAPFQSAWPTGFLVKDWESFWMDQMPLHAVARLGFVYAFYRPAGSTTLLQLAQPESGPKESFLDPRLQDW